ncbi:hypothetical protein NB037_09730 [Rathayibacter sp. ZW T2_19]|uniref:Uncharacterized protein n=1 Tax=Rathayibacter rubneri TaxID=2950106 RepID=A0A9X2E1C7_9MICO|nr:hypothetical protein [Rathayibacter rubneri]MCM6762694.1 hypothetical protein [Rathayibacter rubneri]
MSTTDAARLSPPEPPGIEATLRTLGSPVFGFAVQPRLAELAATTRTDGARTVGVSLSYTYFRHPISRNNPVNFVELTPEQNLAIERAEASTLPQWMIEQITRIRYPTLWDAVRTSRVVPGDAKNALELRLAAHVNEFLNTRDPHHVPVRAPRVAAAGRLSSADLLETTCVIVDRQPYHGRVLDAGPHLAAFGARVDRRYLTVVYDTRIAPRLHPEFTTRPPS